MPVCLKSFNDDHRKLFILFDHESSLWATEDVLWKYYRWDVMREKIDEVGLRECDHGNSHFGALSLVNNARFGFGDVLLVVREVLYLKFTKSERHFAVQ